MCLNFEWNIYFCNIRKHYGHWESSKHQGRLRLESWILDHLSIRDAGNGELWLWALHAKPPSEEILHQVAITESRPVPETIFARARVPSNQGKTLSDFFPRHQPHLEREMSMKVRVVLFVTFPLTQICKVVDPISLVTAPLQIFSPYINIFFNPSVIPFGQLP